VAGAWRNASEHVQGDGGLLGHRGEAISSLLSTTTMVNSCLQSLRWSSVKNSSHLKHLPSLWHSTILDSDSRMEVVAGLLMEPVDGTGVVPVVVAAGRVTG
jgi:hypothetical protein